MLRKLKRLTRPKSNKPAAAAALKVFAIPELLEEILIYLPLKVLFAVQGVNKTFRDTIAASDRLRRQMFLLYHTAATSEKRPDSDNLINPLLRHHFGKKASYGASWFIFRWYDKQEKKWCFLQTANSSVRDVSQMRNQKLKHAWGWKENYITYETLQARALPSEKEESWKATHLTAVPCLVDASIGVTTIQRGYSKYIRFPEGKGTLGDFERCVRDFVSMTDEEHMEKHDRRLVRYIWRGPDNLEPVYGNEPQSTMRIQL